VDVDFANADLVTLRRDALVGHLQEIVATAYARRESDLTSDIMRRLERLVLLQVIDKHWRDHLAELDRLKEGIGLRAYGQKDPLLEYKSEAFSMFMDLVESIQEDSIQLIFRAQVAPAVDAPARRAPVGQALHPEARRPMDAAAAQASATPVPEFGPGVASRGGRAPFDPVPRGGAPRKAEREHEGDDEGPRPEPVRKEARVGRNDPCPCGSGKKYKKCCGRDE
jgi:preprotein translocase subunit SecA